MGLGLGGSPGKHKLLMAMLWHAELRSLDKLFIAIFPAQLSYWPGITDEERSAENNWRGGTERAESLDGGSACRQTSWQMENNRRRQKLNREVKIKDKLKNLAEN